MPRQAILPTSNCVRAASGRIGCWWKVALRMDQEDDFEEEDLVLPLIRERLSVAQHGEIVQHLLDDPQAEDPTWVVTWLRHARTETERPALVALRAPWVSTPSATVAPTVEISRGMPIFP